MLIYVSLYSYSVAVKREYTLPHHSLYDTVIGAREDHWPSRQFVELLASRVGDTVSRAYHDQISKQHRVGIPHSLPLDQNRIARLVAPQKISGTEKRLKQKMQALTKRTTTYGSLNFVLTRVQDLG
jgi:hypothetical protein